MRIPSKRAIETAVTTILDEIVEHGDSTTLDGTPERVARMLIEVTSGYSDDPKAILGTAFHESYDEIVIVRDVPFWSLCEHHLLPFTGLVDVGYIPDGAVVGLSKIPRLVHCFGRRLQLQERLTKDIGESLDRHVTPLGVAVRVRGRHTCMTMRGIRSSGEMVTSYMSGAFRDDESARGEFLSLIAR